MEGICYGTPAVLQASNSVWTSLLNQPLRFSPLWSQVINILWIPSFLLLKSHKLSQLPPLHFLCKHLTHPIFHFIHFLYPMTLLWRTTNVPRPRLNTSLYKFTELSPPTPKTNKQTNQLMPLCLEARGWTSSTQEQQTSPGTEMERELHHVSKHHTGRWGEEKGWKQAHLQHRSTKDWA